MTHNVEPRELVPSEARSLYEQSRLDLDPEDFGQIKSLPCYLLDSESAQWITRRDTDCSDFLDSVLELSEDAAKVIVKHVHKFDYDESSHQGMEFELNGLRQISEEVAIALTKYPLNELSLNGLQTISPEVLRILVAGLSGQGRLHLNGISHIGPEHQFAFEDKSREKEKFLALNGVMHLDSLIAGSLASWASDQAGDSCMCTLSLAGLTKIESETVATLFRTYGGCIQTKLENVSSVNPQALRILAHKNNVELPAVTNLQSGVPEAVASLDGSLCLSGLKTISHKEAELLARAELDKLCLGGIEELDLPVANALSKTQAGILCLNNLLFVGEDACRILSQCNAQLKLDRLVVAAMDWEFISEAQAGLLSKHVGALGLGGLKSLTTNISSIIVRHRGPYINLDGLSELSVSSIRALREYTGRLSFGGLKKVSAEVLFELNELQAWSIDMRGLASIPRNVVLSKRIKTNPLPVERMRNEESEVEGLITSNAYATPDRHVHNKRFTAFAKLFEYVLNGKCSSAQLVHFKEKMTSSCRCV